MTRKLKIDYTTPDEITQQLCDLDNSSITKSCPLGIYLTANEVIPVEVTEALTKDNSPENGIHIGFSGMHNFDIMAQRKSPRGLICDINPQNTLFIHYVLPVICESKDRFQCVENIKTLLKNHGADRHHPKKDNLERIIVQYNVLEGYRELNDLDQLNLELTRTTSWLCSDEAFEHIKLLAMQNKIAYLTEDIQNHKTFDKIRQILEQNSCSIDTLYVSNISYYMGSPVQRKNFTATFNCLTNGNSLVINSLSDKSSDLIQKTVRTEEMKKSNSGYNFFYSQDILSLYDDLNDELNEMEKYGKKLQNQHVAKGDVLCSLTIKGREMLNGYFNQNFDDIMQKFPKFKQDFIALMNSEKYELGQYRFKWQTCLYNVAACLTGIGTIILAARYAHSLATNQRFIFFGSKSKTSSEVLIEQVNDQFKNIACIVPA